MVRVVPMQHRRTFASVMDREPPSRTFISVVMVLAALLHVGIAISAFYIDDTPFHWVSAIIFLMAAGGCAHVAWRIENIKVVAWAGALTLTAYASRAGVIVYAMLYDMLDVSDARAWLIMFSWMLVTLYAYAIFVRGLAPLSRLHRIRRMARDDV